MRTQFITRKQQAEALKISIRHLDNLTRAKILPVAKLGKLVRYNPEHVAEAITLNHAVQGR